MDAVSAKNLVVLLLLLVYIASTIDHHPRYTPFEYARLLLLTASICVTLLIVAKVKT